MKINYLGLFAVLIAGLVMTSCAKPEEQLKKAIEKNDKDAVASIIKDKKVNLNFYGKDAKNVSFLTQATHKPEIFYILANAGVKINPKSWWEKTIITRVILGFNTHSNPIADQKKMISILLKQGADINALNQTGVSYALNGILNGSKSFDMFRFLLDNGANPKLKGRTGQDLFAKLFKVNSKGKIKKRNYEFLRELQKRKLNSSNPELAKKINTFHSNIKAQEKKMGKYIKASILKATPRKEGGYTLEVKLNTKFKTPVRYVHGILIVELNGQRLVQREKFISHNNTSIKPEESLKISVYCRKKAGKVLTGNLAKANSLFLVTSYNIPAKTSTGYKKIELEKYNVRD